MTIILESYAQVSQHCRMRVMLTYYPINGPTGNAALKKKSNVNIQESVFTHIILCLELFEAYMSHWTKCCLSSFVCFNQKL